MTHKILEEATRYGYGLPLKKEHKVILNEANPQLTTTTVWGWEMLATVKLVLLWQSKQLQQRMSYSNHYVT